MKNKIIDFSKFFLFLLTLFFLITANSQEIQFKSSKILSLDNGNILKAEDGVSIIGIKDLIIESDSSEYIKDKSLIKYINLMPRTFFSNYTL